jgi:hypothetical protein
MSRAPRHTDAAPLIHLNRNRDYQGRQLYTKTGSTGECVAVFACTSANYSPT